MRPKKVVEAAKVWRTFLPTSQRLMQKSLQSVHQPKPRLKDFVEQHFSILGLKIQYLESDD